MLRRPPSSSSTDPILPYATLFRSLAQRFGQHWRNGLACRISVVAKTESIALAIDAGGFVGAADGGQINGAFAIADLLQSNCHRAAGAARNHHRLVVVNETACCLNGRIRLGFRIGHAKLDGLADRKSTRLNSSH